MHQGSLMKVALCLYGPYRQFNLITDAFRQHLFGHLSVDVFLCVYDAAAMGLYPAEPLHPRHTHQQNETSLQRNKFAILPYIGTKAIETFDLETTTFTSAVSKLRHKIGIAVDKYPLVFWANLWAQERVVDLKNNLGQKYDYVIVSRADILYQNSLPSWCFQTDKLTLHRKFGCSKPCDFWYMGNENITTVAAQRLDNFPSDSKHPHQLFTEHLQKHNIAWSFADLPLNVVQRRYTGWWYTPYIPDPNLPKVI
jgi:hypothetical protein